MRSDSKAEPDSIRLRPRLCENSRFNEFHGALGQTQTQTCINEAFDGGELQRNNGLLQWGTPILALLLVFAMSLLNAGCSDGGVVSTTTPALALAPIPVPPSVITSPTFCTGGDVATSVAGEPYFAYPANMNWSFEGTYQDTTTALTNYSNVVSTSGSLLFNGKNLTSVTENNSLNGGAISSSYFTDANVAQEWTPFVNGATSVPIDQFLFPLMVGKRCRQSIGDVNFGDVDGDGVADMGSMEIETTMLAFEDITVPAKTYLKAVKTRTTIRLGVILSSTGEVFNETDSFTEWRAKNVGLVKRNVNAVGRGNGFTFTVDAAEALTWRYSELPYAANDLIYDPVSSKLYASIAGNAPIYANQILAIDPVTGQATGSVLVGNNPGPLAVSDDGSQLYVGMLGASEIQSINLPAMTTNPSFTLGNDPFFGPYFAEDIEAMPGDPNSVAISLINSGISPRHAGVAIFTNGVQLFNKTPRHTGSNRIVFGNNANTLYGINNETTEFGFRVMAVSPTGAVVSSITPNLVQNFGEDIQYSNGEAYLSHGRIIDPVALMQAGSFTFSGGVSGVSVAPDIGNNRVYFLQSNIGAGYIIQSFDATTRTPVGSFSVASNLIKASALQKMGSNGLAFHTFDWPTSGNQAQWKIVLVHEGVGL